MKVRKLNQEKPPIFFTNDGQENTPKRKYTSSECSVSSSSKEFASTSSTPWVSIWIVSGMQFLVGINISIYYMSMWPYLSSLDPSSNVNELGFVVAACSLGCSLANPLFGWWHQMSFSTSRPTMIGFACSAIGQLWYGLLPSLNEHSTWHMISARFVTGCGAGSLSVLRAYISTASVPADRLKCVSISTAACVLGMSAGPVIQACFTPLGAELHSLGWLKINMYTSPALVMTAINISAVVVMACFFQESYAGVISESQKKEDPFMVVPRFDRYAAIVCTVVWVINCVIATNVEVISAPVTIAFYNWNDTQAVLYNGVLECLACVVSVAIYLLIAYTRVGEGDKRKQILLGLALFVVFHLCNIPFPFYEGPLDIRNSNVSSTDVGGCDQSYDWCSHTVRTPIWLYIFCFVVVNGIAFPFVGSPNGTLFSEVLGPRNQGMMQGLYSFFGSIAQFGSPILVTLLFQNSGYKYVIYSQLLFLAITIGLFVLFYKRLVPLQMNPPVGRATKYKNGILTRF